MLNIKIQQFINTVNGLCMQAVNDGTPIKAIELALKDIIINGITPLANQAIKAECEKAASVAQPIGKQEVKKIKEESEEM